MSNYNGISKEQIKQMVKRSLIKVQCLEWRKNQTSEVKGEIAYLKEYIRHWNKIYYSLN